MLLEDDKVYPLGLFCFEDFIANPYNWRNGRFII